MGIYARIELKTVVAPLLQTTCPYGTVLTPTADMSVGDGVPDVLHP